jgi:hypothetical protein
MKKIAQIFFMVLILMGFYACGEKDDKNDVNSNKPNSKGVDTLAVVDTNGCDYYVENKVAEIMIKKYETDFHQKALAKQFWIDKCLIMSIKVFLDNNSGYDGVRFLLGVEKKLIGKKSTLVIVPTIPSTTGLPYDRHVNQFGVSIPLANCESNQEYINLPATEGLNRVNRFGLDFRKESQEGQRGTAAIKPLSIGIWISKCKIDKLVELYKPASNLDGLMAIAASYYEDDERRKRGDREFVVQSTFIFVPTVNQTPNWGIVKPPKGWKDTGGFNHGELCPRICD